MTTELANCFIEYPTVKEEWDVARIYHSKKNDKVKIAQLVIRAGGLQQGEKTVLTCANELRMIYSPRICTLHYLKIFLWTHLYVMRVNLQK